MLVALVVGLLAPEAHAQSLYAVSVRTYSDSSYKGIEGNLYEVNPESAVTSLVAPLRLEGRSIGLDGLAINRKTGEVFGVTAPATGPIPHSLVRLDPRDGAVTLVGDLGAYGSDLSFDDEGSLFIWLPKTGQVGKVDLETGKVTALGRPRSAASTEGGIEIISPGVAVVAGSGANGTLDRVDLKSGEVISAVHLHGARYPELIVGLAQSPEGTLLGVNTNGGAPAIADLVSIDKNTGQVATLGPLPNNTDAIAFGQLATGPAEEWDLDHWRAVVFPLLLVIVIGAFIVFRRKV
jgi:hypothetical protein